MTPSDYDCMRSSEIIDGSLPKVSFVFDLDGTLVDSVYQKVLARRSRPRESTLPFWRIHRKMGMRGGLFTNMLLRETDYHIDSGRIERLPPLSTITQPTSSPYLAPANFLPF